MTTRCKLTQSLLIAITLLGTASAWGEGSCGDNLLSDVADLSFMCATASASNVELRMSRIAALRANSDAVRQLASNLVDYHSKARRKLKEIAAAQDYSISDLVGYEDAQRLLLLQRHVGDDFDREYLTQLVTEERQIKHLLEEYRQNNNTAELQTFAETQLSALNGRSGQLQALADSR